MNVIETKQQNGNCHCRSASGITQKIEDVSKLITTLTEDYDPDEIFISFNGGKDCTVLLDLCLRLAKTNRKPRVIYIQPKNPFAEVEDFIGICEKTYGIEIEIVQGSLKVALEEICRKNPSLKVVIMGCRRTDPHCKTMNTLQKTDAGWPELLRVNPLLDWTYNNIWDYIKENNVPYCKLYDEGYTSIGDRTNTKPNPSLLIESQDGVIRYRPASELEDENLERSGRC